MPVGEPIRRGDDSLKIAPQYRYRSAVKRGIMNPKRILTVIIEESSVVNRRLATPRLRARRAVAEPLEERLVLSALSAGLAPFASTDGGVEADAAFIGAPDPAPTSAEGRFYVGSFHDMNKTGGADSELCWAAASSNVLAYTNWGFAAKAAGVAPAAPRFVFDSDIFSCFINNFTNVGGKPRYGLDWFLTGSYAPQGWTDWAQVRGSGGAYYPGIETGRLITFLASDETGDSLIRSMSGYLEHGWGVTVGIGWYSAAAPAERTGGHELTVWGYTYDDGYEPSDPRYYTGLVVTDSDDGVRGTKTVSVEWNPFYDQYRLSGYGSGNGWIEDFTCLQPTRPLTGISVTGYRGPYDGQPHSVTISGIDETEKDSYTITYRQNGIQTVQAPSYTAQGTHVVEVLIVKNDYEAVWSAPVEITISEPAPKELAAPKIGGVVSTGRNTQRVTWNAVAGAAGYEIAWSADGGASWSSRAVSDLSYQARNLPYGEAILYRVRALGDGVHTAASAWSDEKSLLVNPSDIDGDGFIGPGDFALLSAVWFASERSENWDPRFDVDGDGFVGPGDFTYISVNWFKTSGDSSVRYPV